jgi:hypothetical protein
MNIKIRLLFPKPIRIVWLEFLLRTVNKTSEVHNELLVERASLIKP